MRAVDIIAKKRDNIELSPEEINFFLTNYDNQVIPDYQMSALLMAIYVNDLTDLELFHFTKAMINSGSTLSFDDIDNFVVDKHSSGGVGDKITLSLSPLLATFGISTAKLSGRGLGHTGGTIDKFESLENFKFSVTEEELKEKMKTNYFGIMGACPFLVPLDKKIYNLRDVTATVGAMPLMVSSILSKKLALKSDLILLDLKVGSGAFISTLEEGRKLANKMMTIAKMFNRSLICMLTNMDQPLGLTVGNYNEVLESIAVLDGSLDNDFSQLLKEMTVEILLNHQPELSKEEAIKMVNRKIKSGEALTFYKTFIAESGGDLRAFSDSVLKTYSSNSTSIIAKSDAYIKSIDTKALGDVAMKIGAGREKTTDEINHKVGMLVFKKVGEFVMKGDVILRIDHEENLSEELIKETENAFVWSGCRFDPNPVVLEIIK